MTMTVEGVRGTRGLGMAARKSPDDLRQLDEHPVSLRRIGALFAPYRGRLLLVVALIVLSSAVGLATPFLTRGLIDEAIPQQNVPLLLLLAGGMVAVSAISALIGVVQTWLSTVVGQQVMHRLRTEVFTHLQRMPLHFFTRTRAGEVQSRLTNDINGMQSVVTSTATSVASNLTTTVGTAVAMVVLSWRLSLLSLIVLPPAIYLTRRVARLRRTITQRAQRSLADLQSQIEQSLSISGVRLTKTLGTGRQLAQEFADTSTELTRLEVQSQLAGRWRMATMSIVFAAIPAILYLAAGLPATGGGMTIGTLVAFTALQAALFRPLMGVLNVGVQVCSSMALFSRVFEYLDLPVEIDEPSHPVRIEPAEVTGRLTLDRVSYRYPGSDTAALSEISLDIPAGHHVAVVGATGSGKSTLAALLSRLADPTTGSVRIDGIDLRRFAATDLAAVVGVVSQETYLLHATIGENLRMARPEATDDELEQAVNSAQLTDVLAALPKGLDTMVGARGHRFSGGEQQRIALARTLLRQPRILVLDEATSALDTRTEQAVQHALCGARRVRTTVTIAHRLSTVRHADLIVVLDGGRIVESGRHDELADAEGRYAQLLRAQDPYLSQAEPEAVPVLVG